MRIYYSYIYLGRDLCTHIHRFLFLFGKMATINVEVDICDCDCQYCEYNIENTMFEVTCQRKDCGYTSYHYIATYVD